MEILEFQNPAPATQGLNPGSSSSSNTNQNQAIQQLTEQIAHLKELVKEGTPARSRPFRGRGRSQSAPRWGRGRGRGFQGFQDNQSPVIDLTFTPQRGQFRGSQRGMNRGRFQSRGRGHYNNNNF